MRIVSTLLLIALASIITACPAQPATGKLEVKITGLTADATPDVTVTGPNKFSQTITAPGSTSTIIENLPLGSYKVVASDITANSKTYTPTITDSPATVNATTTSSISVVYATP
jgi:uncharacterized protein (DUF2141 family)